MLCKHDWYALNLTHIDMNLVLREKYPIKNQQKYDSTLVTYARLIERGRHFQVSTKHRCYT